MKKKIISLVTAICFFGVNFLHAQVYVGATVGYLDADTHVSSGISENILPDINSVGSATLGLTAEVGLDDKLSLVSGLHMRQRGFNIHAETGFDAFGINVPVGVKIENRLKYIEIPLHLKYSIGNEKYTAFVSAGPSISYGTSGTLKAFATTFIDIELTNMDIDFSDPMYKRTSVNGDITLGGEMAYGMGKVQAGISYGRSFGKFLSDNMLNADLMHSGVSFNIGYSIAL